MPTLSLFLMHKYTSRHCHTRSQIMFLVYPVWPTSGKYLANNTAPPFAHSTVTHSDKSVWLHIHIHLQSFYTQACILYMYTQTQAHNLFISHQYSEGKKTQREDSFACTRSIPSFPFSVSNSLSRGCVCVFLSLWYKH